MLAGGPVTELSTRLELLPWAPEAEPGAVVEAWVAGHDDEFDLTYLDFAGGRLSVPRHDAAAGSRQRVRVLARDVSLALERPTRTSVLNIFPASIVEISEAGGARGPPPPVTPHPRGRTPPRPTTPPQP